MSVILTYDSCFMNWVPTGVSQSVPRPLPAACPRPALQERPSPPDPPTTSLPPLEGASRHPLEPYLPYLCRSARRTDLPSSSRGFVRSIMAPGWACEIIVLSQEGEEHFAVYICRTSTTVTLPDLCPGLNPVSKMVNFCFSPLREARWRGEGGYVWGGGAIASLGGSVVANGIGVNTIHMWTSCGRLMSPSLPWILYEAPGEGGARGV